MRLHATIVLASFLASAAACGAGDSGGRGFRSIGTAGTGGIYYPLGGALASRLSVADPDRRYTAEVTGGAVENVNRVASGEMDIAFVTGNTLHDAYHGDAEDGTFRTLRVVAPLYPNLTHVLAGRGARVASVRDLRGTRISVGAPGSGTEQIARQLLQAAGLGYGDVDQRFLSFTESAAALRDGSIDAAVLSVGYPAGAVLEAVATGGARLLPIDGEIAADLVERHAYYTMAVIPAGSYPFLERALPTVAVMNWIIARESLDGPTVGRILTILRDEREALAQVHGIAHQIDLTMLDAAPIPLHPAAR